MALRQAHVTAADWQRCKEAFGETLCLPEEARRTCLDAACAGNEGLSRAVRELLASHARSGRFLDPPIVTRSLHARLLLGSEARGSGDDEWLDMVVAGRYRLRERIGSGAVGDVYGAEDLLTGEAVACKLLRHAQGERFPRTFRSEIAALRLLRIPGVVRMIEEGTEDGVAYIVMEMAAGAPFPGVPRPSPWQRIAETAISLLETLDRFHQAGFVHRDLKPANVLVDAEGRPTVLDLGLALHPGEARRPEDGIVGTPNYLPPEQLRGDPATPSSDLFSVGVMLYEALSGKLPHGASTLADLIPARQYAPPSLREVVPECPAPVADLVMRLLKPEPEDRPRTAAEAILLVAGESRRRGPEELPWLGDDGAVRAVVAAAERGESIDISGAPGSGRTRCLAEAAARLERSGKRTLRFRPGGGFSGLLDAAETAAFARLEEARDLARTRLAEALRGGAAAFADDFQGLEPWVAEVVSGCREHGTVVRALREPAEGARALEPLSRADLLDLFHGPDRAFHLREDAADVLFARSRGNPRAVAEEAFAWVRAGYARWERGRLSMTRDSIDRLRENDDEPPRTGRRDLRPLPSDLRRLAALVQVAGRQATPEGLAPLVREPAWRVDAHLRELHSMGVLRYDERSPASTCAPVDVLSVLTQDELRAAHARLAETLPEGDEQRLRHLVAARELGAFPEEMRLRAQRLASEGGCSRAISLLEEALVTLRNEPGHPGLIGLLEDLVLLGFRAWSVSSLDHALYELEMAPEQGARVRRLADLARSALVLLRGTWERSLIAIEAMGPFPDARLELSRQTIRILAARRGGLERERAVIEDVSGWVATCGQPEARRSLVIWLAWLRYKEGRYEEAARLHGQAAGLTTEPVARASSLWSRAVTLMDDQRLDDALEAAREGLRTIATVREVALEVRLLVVQRSIEYRLGVAGDVDLELPDLAQRAAVPETEATSSLTEAALAWRLGKLDVARRLAARTARIWTELGLEHFACLPKAICLASTAAPDEAEVRGLAARIGRCPVPGIAAQALGLLAMSRPDLSLRIPDKWLEALPKRTWPVRREVLSIEEALSRRV